MAGEADTSPGRLEPPGGTAYFALTPKSASCSPIAFGGERLRSDGTPLRRAFFWPSDACSPTLKAVSARLAPLGGPFGVEDPEAGAFADSGQPWSPNSLEASYAGLDVAAIHALLAADAAEEGSLAAPPPTPPFAAAAQAQAAAQQPMGGAEGVDRSPKGVKGGDWSPTGVKGGDRSPGAAADVCGAAADACGAPEARCKRGVRGSPALATQGRREPPDALREALRLPLTRRAEPETASGEPQCRACAQRGRQEAILETRLRGAEERVRQLQDELDEANGRRRAAEGKSEVLEATTGRLQRLLEELASGEAAPDSGTSREGVRCGERSARPSATVPLSPHGELAVNPFGSRRADAGGDAGHVAAKAAPHAALAEETAAPAAPATADVPRQGTCQGPKPKWSPRLQRAGFVTEPPAEAAGAQAVPSLGLGSTACTATSPRSSRTRSVGGSGCRTSEPPSAVAAKPPTRSEDRWGHGADCEQFGAPGAAAGTALDAWRRRQSAAPARDLAAPAPDAPACASRVSFSCYTAVETSRIDAGPNAGPNAGRLDASQPDASRLNVSWLDASRLDASWFDASRFDASRLNASRLNASQLDTSRIDASRIDASRFDASQHDVSRLDASRRATYAYMHECIHAYMYTCTHAHMHTCIQAYMHTCIQADMHTCIQAHMHTFIHAYMHTCIHAHMHTYIQACMPNIHTCAHAYMHTCLTSIHAHMHTCIHAYMHTCIHAYMHTCIHAYMHTCIHAYMHTCIHAYMHKTHTHIKCNTGWMRAGSTSAASTPPRCLQAGFHLRVLVRAPSVRSAFLCVYVNVN